jgi:hypothetical protein
MIVYMWPAGLQQRVGVLATIHCPPLHLFHTCHRWQGDCSQIGGSGLSFQPVIARIADSVSNTE